MRIGIDLDDTLCNTSETVQKYLKTYASTTKFSKLDIMNEKDLTKEFFNSCLEKIYNEVELKPYAKEVIQRLREKRHTFYAITARSNTFVPSIKNVEEITQKWLEKQNIKVEKIITASYGEKKAEVCQEYQIDIMVDDDPYNIKAMHAFKINCILYDDKERFTSRENYATNWLEVEKIIERNS